MVRWVEVPFPLGLLPVALLAVALLGGGATAARDKKDSARAQEPEPCRRALSLTETIDAALRHGRLTRGLRDSMMRRSRWTALLPRVRARVLQTWREASSLDVRVDAPDRIDLDANLGLSWDIRATWDLGRLLFGWREVAIERLAQSRRLTRQVTTERVVSLFYRRQDAKEALRRARVRGEPAQDGDLIRLRETSALLNELTGRRFCVDSRRGDGRRK